MIAPKTTIQAARVGARSFAGKRPAIAPTFRLTTSHSLPRTATASARRYLSAPTATVGSTATSSSSLSPRSNLALGVAGGLVLAGLHSATGSQNDFFDYRFTTEKSADDLASFYGGEEFMELFSVLPFVGQFMMRNGYFDEEGNYFTTGLPGTLKVSMVFSDEANEETGNVEWFNKRERFRNMCFGWTCWDMVTNFGFRTLEDGQIEVYHYGEYFHGNLPVVSQLAFLVFKTHARWVAWATEHHINHFAFTAETEGEEEMEEESRKNMPFFLLKHYAWSDLMAMLFGTKDELEEDKSSFLVRRPTNVDKGDDDKLPIQRAATKIQISQDIASDRMATKGLLSRSSTSSPDDVKALLTRNYTKNSDGSNTQGHAYRVATEAARLRHLARRESNVGGSELAAESGSDSEPSSGAVSAKKDKGPKRERQSTT